MLCPNASIRSPLLRRSRPGLFQRALLARSGGRGLAWRSGLACGQRGRAGTDLFRHALGAGSGYGASVATSGRRPDAENEGQFQALVRFADGAAGTIESSRIATGKVFGVYWEVSGTEGTIVMDGERFDERRIARYGDGS